jgi:transposase
MVGEDGCSLAQEQADGSRVCRSRRAARGNASLSEEMKQCPKCKGSRFTNLTPEESSVYDYVPGHFVRKVHRREKAACQCGNHIVVAPPPPKLVVGGQYGFGFAAFLIVEKCADSIPIHRIEKRFERLRIPMSRATMNDVLHAAAECATPLVDRLRRRIPALEIVLADETSIKIQDREKRGFIWVFHGYDHNSVHGLQRRHGSGEQSPRRLLVPSATQAVRGSAGNRR